jgi:hypothetical protein
MTDVLVVDLPNSQWAVVEYTEKGMLQRKIIPRAFVGDVKGGTVALSQDVLNAGLEYADVELPQVLPDLPLEVSTRLQDALRRRGIWTQRDYRNKSKVVAEVLSRLQCIDLATVLNAVL